MQGLTVFNLGELGSARVHFEQSNALYDSQQHHSLAFVYGSSDTGVAGLSFIALILDQALKKSNESVAMARALAHPFSLAQALLWASWFHQFRRAVCKAQRQADSAIRLSMEHGFATLLAVALTFRGWALAMQGSAQKALRNCNRDWLILMRWGLTYNCRIVSGSSLRLTRQRGKKKMI